MYVSVFLSVRSGTVNSLSDILSLSINSELVLSSVEITRYSGILQVKKNIRSFSSSQTQKEDSSRYLFSLCLARGSSNRADPLSQA